MLISWNILRKMVRPSHEPTARELADILTMSTVEVDAFTDQARNLDHIVIGEVVESKAHPNADKLKLAQVNIGSTTVEVVCGGVNLVKNMKVALALPGARVKWHGRNEWVILEPATIRGVNSQGMICAANELNLPDEKAVEHGVMDLSHLESAPGAPLAYALGYDDIILDIDNKSLTNRPDLWGHWGLARELTAIWNLKLEPLLVSQIKSGRAVKLKATIKAPKLVNRYMAVAVNHLTVAESPLWLKRSLESLGVRPINNIVDVTNYVMLELGQPIHAFDADKLAGADIIVRTAKKGESLTTLDNVNRELEDTDLVIADKKQAIALAGVMGGLATGITPSTTTIILESANFEPVGIRQTSTRLGLRTDASIRFEKSLDPNLSEIALQRAVTLFKEIIPSAQVASKIVDEYPLPLQPAPINLPLPWLASKLGVELAPLEIKNILERLGFVVEMQDSGFKVTPPTWRAGRDVTIAEDLVEEVARIYGYGKIPLALPEFSIIPPERDERKDWHWRIRDLLTNLHWTETYTYSFVTGGGITNSKNIIELLNPVDKSQPCLRYNLLDNLIAQLTHNTKRLGARDIKMYEIGRVFINQPSNWSADENNTAYLPSQSYHLALCQRVIGDSASGFMNLRGVIEAALALVGLEAEQINFTNKNHTDTQICLNDKPIGFLKEQAINESVLVIGAELCLDDVPISYTSQEYKILPDFPAIVRDVSVTVPPGVLWQDLESFILQTSTLIEAVELFDVYAERGSLAFHIVFRSKERTLESVEVDKIMHKIINDLKAKFQAEVRE